MAELIEGGARDHVLDFAEGAIGPNAVSGFGEAEPELSAGTFNDASERAVVNDLASNLLETTSGLESVSPDQQAATCRTGGRFLSAGGPFGRI